jgi:hypothetical protein
MVWSLRVSGAAQRASESPRAANAPASADQVWDACTNPERIPHWFLPVSGDLRLHGRFHLQDNASGTIERCDPPKTAADRTTAAYTGTAPDGASES